LADPAYISIYLRYEVLYPADFQNILQSIESAYNRLSVFSGVRDRSSNTHLRINSVHTGNSITTILHGNADTLILLALLVHFLSKEHHEYWQTQKTKWEAKLAERKFRQQDNTDPEVKISAGLRQGDPNLVKASNVLETLVRKISRSWRIISVDIKISVIDEEKTDRPKRRITFDDN
jgi:hypothetical protein